jgi:hypothetical protein
MAAAMLVFWIGVALAYEVFRHPNDSRYAYPAAMFLIVAIAEFVARPPSRGVTVLVAAAAVASVVSNLGFLRDGARLFDHTSEYARAELGALEEARPVVAPSFEVDGPATTTRIGYNNLFGVDARHYFAAVDAYGSPADKASDLLRAPEPVREAADLVLVEAERVALRPATVPRSGCVRRNPVHGALALSSAPGTLFLKSPGPGMRTVWVRRLATGYRFGSLGAVASRTAVALAFAKDRMRIPWHVHLQTASPIIVCRRIPLTPH